MDNINRKLIKGKEVLYVGKKDLPTYLRRILDSLLKKENNIYHVIQVSNYKPRSYGVRGQKYILLGAGAAHLLDTFKNFYDRTKRVEFTTIELGEVLGIPVPSIAKAIWNHGNELENRELVVFKYQPKPKPITISLTKLCIEYITRTGIFKS